MSRHLAARSTEKSLFRQRSFSSPPIYPFPAPSLCLVAPRRLLCPTSSITPHVHASLGERERLTAALVACFVVRRVLFLVRSGFLTYYITELTMVVRTPPCHVTQPRVLVLNLVPHFDVVQHYRLWVAGLCLSHQTM